MNIEITEIVKRPEFLEMLANIIADKNWENFNSDWRDKFYEEFQSQLQTMIKTQVTEYLDNNKDNVRVALERELNRLTKSDLIEMLKTQKLF